MKIFKSIKWRLQIWYGLILVFVLAALGVTAYQLQRQELFGRIDNELHTRVGVLAASLHHPPPHQMPPDFGGPPPGDFPSDSLPERQRNRPSPDYNLAPENTRFFDSNDPHHFYFIISAMTRDGITEIARSTNQPNRDITSRIEGIFAGELNRVDNLPPGPRTDHPPAFFNDEDCRQTLNALPSGEMILVGCSIEPELRQLQGTAIALIGVGVIVLLFGLAGGWWISSRAIRPVENISGTAVKISAGDLSQRINTAETESELGQLAAVLNSTFTRLEAAFAHQKQFASDAAHELRTPVSVILTQTQAALNREHDAAEYKQTVEACQRAAQRMRKLISALLELTRLDAGQEQMKRLRFDFSKTIADCVELVRPLAEERGVKILLALAPLEIEGDPERLGQMVTNLLTNAVQYNHDGGEIKLAATRENGMAVLTVSDTGQGISAEDLPHVFERFYRADKSRSSGNAGLGLAISKAIVTAHGGTLDVSSQENVGTTFTVRLPAVV